MHLLSECRDASFKGQGTHGHLPAFTRLTDNILLSSHRFIEENFIEVRLPGHLPDRTNIDTGLMHGYQQIRQTVATLACRFGPTDNKAPVSKLR